MTFFSRLKVLVTIKSDAEDNVRKCKEAGFVKVVLIYTKETS